MDKDPFDQYRTKFIGYNRKCLYGKCSVNLKVHVCEDNIQCALEINSDG